MTIPSHPFRATRILGLIFEAFIAYLASWPIIIGIVSWLICRNGPTGIPWIWGETIPALLCGMGFSYACIRLGSCWYRTRFEYSEAEHFVILFILSLGVSTIYAAANFAMYLAWPSAFLVDEKVTTELKGRLEESIDRFRARAEFYRKVQERLAHAQPSEFSYGGGGHWLGNEEYRAIIGKDLRIVFYKPPPTRENIDPRWAARYELGNAKASTDVVLSPEAKNITLADLEKEARHQADVQENDGLKPTTEYLARMNAAERDLRSVPFSLFFYQEVMMALGADPRHIKAASALPRLLAFLAAVTKYVYGGLFVSLIVMKRWVRPPHGPPAGGATDGASQTSPPHAA